MPTRGGATARIRPSERGSPCGVRIPPGLRRAPLCGVRTPPGLRRAPLFWHQDSPRLTPGTPSCLYSRLYAPHRRKTKVLRRIKADMCRLAYRGRFFCLPSMTVLEHKMRSDAGIRPAPKKQTGSFLCTFYTFENLYCPNLDNLTFLTYNEDIKFSLEAFFYTGIFCRNHIVHIISHK